MDAIKQKLVRSITSVASMPFVSNLAYQWLNTFSTIFVLHRVEKKQYGIHGIDPEYLEKCLHYLKNNNYQFLSLPELIHRIIEREPINKKTICFTLDDGYKDQAEELIPILLKFDIQPVFFLITDLLNQKDWPWDSKICWLLENTTQQKISLSLGTQGDIEFTLVNHANKRIARHALLDKLKRLPSRELSTHLMKVSEATELDLPEKAPPEYQPISWEQTRKLEGQGVLFGPHSSSHKIFSCMDLAEVENEIISSSETLKHELSSPVNIFCYPTGRKEDFNQDHCQIVEKHYFSAAVSAIPGYFFHKRFDEMKYSIPRIEIPQNYQTFLRYISWIEAARDTVNWKSGA